MSRAADMILCVSGVKKKARDESGIVMAGLVPAIHVSLS
jgi:hypothetical protein